MKCACGWTVVAAVRLNLPQAPISPLPTWSRSPSGPVLPGWLYTLLIDDDRGNQLQA